MDDEKNIDTDSNLNTKLKSSEQVVNSFTEWEPLEEIILGHPGEVHVLNLGGEGPLTSWLKTFPERLVNEWRQDWNNFKLHSPVSNNYIRKVLYERDNLKKILLNHNVKIYDVDNIKWGDIKYSTPFVKNLIGSNAWNPRDTILPAGNVIIQAPLVYREREYEWLAYRKIMNSFIKRDVKWICSPPITRADNMYGNAKPSVYEYNSYQNNIVNKKPHIWAITDNEPIWEAADILRCGKDFFIQRSHVTNHFGIKWVTNMLDQFGFRVHPIKFQNEYNPVHLDTSIAALRPGLAIYDSERPLDDKTATIFKKSGWKLVPIPSEKFEKTHPYKSHWYFALNLLSINETDVVCDKHIGEYLKSYGFRPHEVDFSIALPLVGGIHCSTADIKRRGYQQSYFSYIDEQEKKTNGNKKALPSKL